MAPVELRQTLLKTFTPPIKYVFHDDFQNKAFNPRLLQPFKDAAMFGIAPGYVESGQMLHLALCLPDRGLIIAFEEIKKKANREDVLTDIVKRNLQDLIKILCGDIGEIYSFDAAPLALSLYSELGLRVKNVIDIPSIVTDPRAGRHPLEVIYACVGDKDLVFRPNVERVFRFDTYAEKEEISLQENDLVQRAWIAQHLASEYGNGGQTFASVKRIDTTVFHPQYLSIISKISSDSMRLDLIKPTETVHEITGRTTSTDANATGSLDIKSGAYKNKVRMTSGGTQTMVTVDLNGTAITLPAVVGTSDGRRASATTDLSVPGARLVATNAITRGREAGTRAEKEKALLILSMIQRGPESVDTANSWFRNLFLSSDPVMTWPSSWSQPPKFSYLVRDPSYKVPSDPTAHALNPSQQTAVNTMLNMTDFHRVTVVWGPPGTGKTSVIARFVQTALSQGHRGIWLIAQSNVAVRNIAEKLVAVHFPHWRLLVSHDFIHEWHEHLYTMVNHNLIKSDEFMRLSPKHLEGCKVVLCTVSMLTNTFLKKFTSHVPMNILVVDEASQIQIGDYIPCFNKFSSLRKICFIGDDKQLPPHGQEDLGDLNSIFEVEHLHNKILLDTQYRMPPQLGDFISGAVYEGKLRSNPSHPIKNDTPAVFFIDAGGSEVQGQSGSSKNIKEAEDVLRLAAHLQEKNHSYRVITPYEDQRHLIESKMKEQELEWGDKCFNVDAFQGNEDDYIIVSIVRTCALGFLTNLRRTNVMLTRCKRGMFIVTSRAFLDGKGKDCLVGQLKEYVGEKAWVSVQDLVEGRVQVK